MQGISSMYYKTKSPPHPVILTRVLYTITIGRVSDRRWHDYLSIYYIDKESCHRVLDTPPILCIKHVSK